MKWWNRHKKYCWFLIRTVQIRQHIITKAAMAHTHTHTLLLSLCVCALDETIWLIFSFFPFLLLSLTHSSLCCSMFEGKKESKIFGYNLLCVGFLVFGSVLSIYVRFDSLSVSFKSERMKMLHLTADRIRMRTHQKRRRKNAHTSTPSTTLQTNPTNTHCTERASARGRPRAPQRNIDVFACQHTIFLVQKQNLTLNGERDNRMWMRYWFNTPSIKYIEHTQQHTDKHVHYTMALKIENVFAAAAVVVVLFFPFSSYLSLLQQHCDEQYHRTELLPCTKARENMPVCVCVHVCMSVDVFICTFKFGLLLFFFALTHSLFWCCVCVSICLFVHLCSSLLHKVYELFHPNHSRRLK